MFTTWERSKHIILKSSVYWVTMQKSEDLMDTIVEACNHAYSFYCLEGIDIGGSRFC